MPEISTSADRLQELKLQIDRFSADRDWGQFHTPKNLAMALSVEAAELLEIFQWEDGSSGMTGFSTSKREAVENEVADVFVYLLRFCSVASIDLLAATNRKLQENAKKYPVELSKGSSKKYDELK